jgi:replication factor C subunit 3/5
VVQRVIKEAASTQNIETKNNPRQFKVVVISEADRLTRDAQAALRRTMEKYISGCRVIMVCENLNKIMAPIRSRCLNIRISAPNEENIAWALEDVATKEGLSNYDGAIKSLTESCSGNLRSAILGLQVWWNHRN